MATEFQDVLKQGGGVIQLNVSSSNLSANDITVTGPAIAETTDGKLVRLPKTGTNNDWEIYENKAALDALRSGSDPALADSAAEKEAWREKIGTSYASQSETDAASVTNKVVVPGYLRIRRDANGAVSIGDLGGDARGTNAINIQASRSNASEVASGFNSTAIGNYSTASAYGSTAIGNYSTASAYDSTAIGNNSTAIGDGSTAIGFNSTASGDVSTAIGNYSTASGDNSTAIGFNSTATQTNSGAFGYRVKSAIADAQELGYWSNSTTRGGAVRVHGTGMVALTIQDRATAFGDGGATAGSEADNTLIREGFALRRDGDDLYIDVNIAGTVKTLNLGTAA